MAHKGRENAINSSEINVKNIFLFKTCATRSRLFPVYGVNRIQSEYSGFDRSTPDSIGVLRIQSEYSGAPECSGFNRSTPELLSAPDSIGVLRSSGVESGILSDSESVFNMWIRSGFVNPLRSSHHYCTFNVGKGG
uniref:Uncharacterized protein n=1 Tax=Anopheles maculatus TaxID=74869 RepID=A0A182SDA6_9DIPT